MGPHESPTAGQEARSHWLAAYGARAASLGLPLTPESVTACMEATTFSTMRNALDTEIEGLRAILGTALATRNRLSMADSLPAEILGHIFLDLATMLPMDLREPGLKRLGWLTVTHVSRRWRNTAIDYPVLWSKFAFNNSQPWSIFLNRSRNAPLTVKGSWETSTGDACFAYALVHARRIQTLSLENVGSESIMKIYGILQEPLPELHALFIRTRKFDRYFDIQLPTDFMSHITPNIKHLCLQSMGLPPGTSDSLRSLELSRWIVSDIPPQSMTYTFRDVLSILQRHSALEHLFLKNMLPPRDPENEADIGLITMPHLNDLRIEDRGHICIDLWALLDTPSTAKITIFSQETSDDVPSIESILPPLIRCSHKYLDDQAFSDLSLRFDTLFTRRATLILAPPQPAAQQTATSASEFLNPAASTSLNIEVAGLNPGAFFRSLTTAIPMKLVKTVVLVSSFRAAEPLNDADIRSALSNADSVSALELHGNVATAGLWALLSTASRDRFLPSLKRLHLHIAALAGTLLNGDVSAINLINRALDERYHYHGLFLESLSFKECDISESSVAHLREAGRWGGQTRVEVD